MKLTDHFHAFSEDIRQGEIEIYNEFSLQHELGLFLRTRLPNCKVQFERNVSHFSLAKTDFVKREMDISILSAAGEKLCAIELKYPRNGQVPETLYGFCKDIAFLEQLVSAGFRAAYFLAVVDDKLFYSGASEGIYGFFRSGVPITGTISKPTGAKDSAVSIVGPYHASWLPINGSTKFCVVEIKSTGV